MMVSRVIPLGHSGRRNARRVAPTWATGYGHAAELAFAMRRIQSSARRSADDSSRGKGIARPEQPREPKQSWRAQSAHAWMSALRQRARFAGRPIPSKHNHVLHGHGACRGAAATSITRPSLGQATVISSLRAHALLTIVRSSRDSSCARSCCVAYERGSRPWQRARRYRIYSERQSRSRHLLVSPDQQWSFDSGYGEYEGPTPAGGA